jgi:L-2-hydroxyglutarate oxidase LhgO
VDVDVDVVVVGAGVVGLACAERLSRAGRSVVVVEQHEGFGRETSSRSSEVIHSGLYYATGSLKATLCVEGARLLYDWCERHGVRARAIGKYIVASSTEEEPALDRLARQAQANGAVEVTRVGREHLLREEPNVRATAGLWSPRTGILDSHGFMQSLVSASRSNGCLFAWRNKLLAVERGGDGYCLSVTPPSGDTDRIATRQLVNAAGLHADEVAALGGVDVAAAGYRQTYVKGSYFRVRRPGLVRHLVYPVPPAGLAGLGLHLTLDLDGGIRLGPDVEVLGHREPRYAVDEGRKPIFLAAVSRYVPGLGLDDLDPDQSGIRPKLGTPGGEARDFVLSEETARGLPGWVNLVGFESPGLTASLATAERVADLLGA